MKLFLILAALLLISCTKKAPTPEQDPFFTRLVDYVDTDKKDLEEFLERFYPVFKKEKIHNLLPKEEYLKRFHDTPELRKILHDYLRGQLYIFLSNSERHEDGLLRFFLRRAKDAKKTLIYFNDPATSLLYNTTLLNQLAEKLPEVNLVVIDGNDIMYKEHSLGPEEIKKSFADALARFLKEKGLMETEKTVHVICHGVFYSNYFLSERHELYDKVVFYAPTVKNKTADRLLNPRKMYKPEEAWAKFIFNVHQARIPQGSTMQFLPVPKTHSFFNVRLEAAFADEYDKGVDLSKMKNMSLLLPENDMLVPHENAGREFFKGKVKVIPKIFHSDIFTMKITSSSYVDEIKAAVYR